MKKIIYVNDISSIKYNHFLLKDEIDIIEDHPFVIKKAGYHHYHFDENDLEEMSKYEKDFTLYREIETLARKDFIEHMKQAFYHHIQSGNMDYILSRLYKVEEGSIQLKWIGPMDPHFRI